MPVSVEGPYFSGSPQDGTLNLYGGSSSDVLRKTQPNQQSLPGQDEEQTLLSPLTGSEEFSIDGTTNIQMVQGDFFSTGIDALHEWIFNLESLVQAQQGDGYVLTDPMRDITYDPANKTGLLIDKAEWTVQGGTKDVIDWNVSFQLSSGVQDVASRFSYVSEEINNQTPVSDDKLVVSGTDVPLGDIDSFSRERSVNLEVSELLNSTDALGDGFQSLGVLQSGVEGEITLDGTVTRNDGDISQIANMYARNLHGRQVEYHDSFTNRIYQGIISQSNSTTNEGTVAALDYRITFNVGQSFV